MKYFFAILLLFSFFSGLKSQDYNNHFKGGEKLKFVIYFGPFHGGYVNSELQIKEFEGKLVYHSVMIATTSGLADKIYKVRDEYQSYFNPETVLPYKSVRDISEGKYKKYDHVYYFHNNLKVIDHKSEEYIIPSDVRDMLSVFYYIRNIDYSIFKIGDIIKINTFFDHELFPFDMRYRGPEKIKTKMGEYNCIKLVPFVEPGRVFESEDDMTIYLSDDVNRVPIRIVFNLKIGSINCDLIEYSGLKN